jgi:hypothetical protein
MNDNWAKLVECQGALWIFNIHTGHPHDWSKFLTKHLVEYVYPEEIHLHTLVLDTRRDIISDQK